MLQVILPPPFAIDVAGDFILFLFLFCFFNVGDFRPWQSK